MTQSIYNIPLKTIKGSETNLEKYKGKVLIIVNTASKCGLTPQYEGLEKLYEQNKEKDFEILGFPANNFMEQEPASDEEIEQFCSINYQVSFPLFSKISVAGENKHPLYNYLIEAEPQRIGGKEFEEKLHSFNITTNPVPEVLWNFEKFIIGKDGKVAARFSPDTTADNPELIKVLETELAK